jgi:osmotically-inducible protein OsmY
MTSLRIPFIVCCAAALLGGLSPSAKAQNPSTSAAPSVQQIEAGGKSSDALSDEAVKARVEAALSSAKFSLLDHVSVSMEKGVVVLQGFVFSAWDLRHAIKIARNAAGGRKVVDDIEIKEAEVR